MATKVEKGLAGIFLDESAFLKAASACKESGIKNFEAISPYPVHGIEEACGIKRSWIPYVTFFAGVVGLSAGLGLTWWTSAVNWPLNVGGKPPFSLPAFIPIMFELTILFAALSSVGVLLYVCGIPRVEPPVIDPDLTCSKFAVFVPQSDGLYNEEKITQIFKSAGASEIKKTEF